MATQPTSFDDDMPAEIDFSATSRGIDVAQLVDKLLKKDIELIEAAR